MDESADNAATLTPPAARQDHTRSALEFIHGLLRNEPAAQNVPALLRELAHAFGGAGAGAAVPADGVPGLQARVRLAGREFPATRLPWDEQPELLSQIRQAPAAVSLVGPEVSWLVTVVQPASEGWLLWLEAEQGRTWGHGEAAALPLAGEALARLAGLRGGEFAVWGRAMEKARRQRQLEGTAQLTGKLAHDFGNVLTGILGFAELTLTQLPTASMPHRYVSEIWQAAQNGARWVEKLRLFSRRRIGPVTPGSIPAAVAAEQARARSAWGAEVALHIALPTQLPLVGVEPEPLQQALAQLLNNAREAITEEGVVTLSARLTELTEADCQELIGSPRPGPHVELTVTDTGPGLSAETRQRLFREPFYSTKVRHRGLGLAMVFGVLQAHGGGLRFGPDPECGTAVRLFLPVVGPSIPPAAQPAPRAGETILIVDDDPLVLRYVATALERAGYRTRSAADGVEALSAYLGPGGPFRLVVTDILMPQMNGFELARRLRDHDPEVNLLFISTEPTPVSGPEEAIERCDFLSKPFRPEALLQAVRTALGRTATLVL